MNRIERISAILIQLQSKKIVKGQEIADRFQISLRTAYRDIRALEESGVPIISEAGLGYSLVEGYRLPPVMFSKEEAIAFLTAEKLIEKFTDAETFQVYSSGLYKIYVQCYIEVASGLSTDADLAVIINGSAYKSYYIANIKGDLSPTYNFSCIANLNATDTIEFRIWTSSQPFYLYSLSKKYFATASYMTIEKLN